MRLGRRFVRFWVLLFVASGTGCAGCGNCWDGGGGSCNIGDICDGGDCFSYDAGPYDADPCTFGPCDAGSRKSAIVTGLHAPQGIATDGIEVFYVDDGMLMQIDQDGSSPLVLATGVDASGGLRSDGLYVYWSGGWGNGIDAGVDDGGNDAGDAGDSGSPAAPPNPGIYAVLVNGGDVQQITSLATLPTFDTDDFNAYVRTPLDDAGTSAIGVVSLTGDGGFAPLATLSGNTGNLHAFARRAGDLVALDQNDIVSVLLDGGGKSILESDAGSLALLQGDDAAVSIGNAAPFFTVQVVGQAAQAEGLATLGPYATYGNVIYVVDQRNGTIYRYDAASIANPPATVVTVGSPIAFLAADATFVYWVTPGPNGAIYSAAVR